MKQYVFIPIYVILAAFFCGIPSPMGKLTAILNVLAVNGPLSLLNPILLFLILSPIMLIVLVYFKGKASNNRSLVFFPIVACTIGYTPYLFDFIFKFEGIIKDILNNSLYIFNIILPISFHILCIILSFKKTRLQFKEEA